MEEVDKITFLAENGRLVRTDWSYWLSRGLSWYNCRCGSNRSRARFFRFLCCLFHLSFCAWINVVLQCLDSLEGSHVTLSAFSILTRRRNKEIPTCFTFETIPMPSAMSTIMLPVVST